MNLEDSLRQALRREPAPRGFAARVMSAASARAVPLRQPWWGVRGLVLRSALAGTSVVLIGGVGFQRYEQRRALEARHQLLTALTVTKVSLQKAQERIHRIAAKPVL